MPIRLSGLSSGLDTEAIVKALMSSYNLQKDNLVKAQTKLSWKQDAWKTMNTSIYGFYTGSLKNAQYSSTYNLKKSTVSSTGYATVTASSSAVNGNQSLEVVQLATTGYLTGGEIKSADESKKLTGSSKISEVKGISSVAGAEINVEVEGKARTIKISGDTTINQLIVQLKDAGLNANFDVNNQRFFISASTSGKNHDFSLTANNESGKKALKSLGLFTTNDTDFAEYQKWAEYATDSAKMDAAVDAEYEKQKLSYASKAKEYADKYNSAKSTLDAIVKENGSLTQMQDKLDEYTDALNSKFSGYEKLDDGGNIVKDANGNVVYDEERINSEMSDDDKKEYAALAKNVSNMTKNISNYNKAQDTMNEYSDRVYINATGNAEAVTATNDAVKYANLTADVDAENATIKSNIRTAFDQKAAYATTMVDSNGWKETASVGAVRITGQDAMIKLNNADFVSNTNNFSINGLTIEVTAKTEKDKPVMITTNTDIDGIYNQIKSFLKDYNTLIKAMDTAYNADSSKGYEPLTSDEKEALTDKEVEEWEKKIKDSLLRKDSILENAASAMKTNMMTAIEINGKKYSLSSFGISTLGYFEAPDNEKGVYHIDGDPDDTNTSGKDDKLRAALAEDPDTVITFFTELAQNVYTDLGKRMQTSSISSAFTIYNDKELAREYSDYKTKISDKTEEITRWEDYYYKKFSKMESALAALNAQQSSLSGFFK